MVKEKYPDFQPEGMQDWEAEQSEEKIQTADRQLHEIIVEMSRYIFDVFRVIYGEDKGAYWDKGVPDKTIKANAYGRSLDDDVDQRLPLECYLDVIDFKKIVEIRQHWALFKPIFNIPEANEKGHAKNLKWMERINELRRIRGHPSEKRHYKVEDFQYIEFIYSELTARIRQAEKNPVLEAPELKEEAGD
jgi:DNA sulfur modification protein DndB